METGTRRLFLSLFPFKQYQPSKMQRLPALQSQWDLFGVPQLLMFEALSSVWKQSCNGSGASTPSFSGCLQGLLFSSLTQLGN